MFRRTFRSYLPLLLLLLLAFAITGPWFAKPGFVWLLDMVWGPHVSWINLFTNSMLAQLPLWGMIQLAGWVLPLELVQKLLLTGILWAIGVDFYRLSLRYLPRRFALLAGVFGMTNPWVFERLTAGHWQLLLGYAFFPFLIGLVLNLLEKRNRRSFLLLAIGFGIYPWLNLHWAYISLWVGATLTLVWGADNVFWHTHHARTALQIITHKISQYGRTLLCYSLVALGIVVILNGWWWIPSLAPNMILNKIHLADFAAFPTRSDPAWGVEVNVLSLYGFWGEEYLLPKDYSSLWPLMTAIVLVVVAFGLFWAPRKARVLARTLLVVFVPTTLIAIGYGANWTRPLINWLYVMVPGFRGLRETDKLVGILAATCSIGIAFGLYRLQALLALRSRWLRWVIPLAGLVVILNFYGPILVGASGQVAVNPYPAGWSRVETVLAQDHARQVLFLPWHAYLNLPWAENHSIANPAKSFFLPKVISSNLLDNALLDESVQQAWDDMLTGLVQRNETIDQYASFLKAQGVTHIVLARVNDYQQYTFLERSTLLQRYADQDIVVYQLPQ